MSDEDDADDEAERKELPYAVEVAFQRLDDELGKMIHDWQDRGWRTGAVRDEAQVLIEGLKDF